MSDINDSNTNEGTVVWDWEDGKLPACPCETELLVRGRQSRSLAPWPISSNDEKAEKSPICLDIFKTREAGIPK
jgi:hypothetical protein